MIVCFVSILVLACREAASTELTHLLATKCCPLGQELNATSQICVERARGGGGGGGGAGGERVTEELVTRARARGADEVAWLTRRQLEGAAAGAGAGLFVRYGLRPACARSRTLALVDLPPDRARWLPNGTLELRSPSARRAASTPLLFAPHQFCADRFHDGTVLRRAFLLCPCDRHPVRCVSKCCRFDHALKCEGETCKCAPFQKQWLAFREANQLPDNGSDVSYEILEGNEPTCPNGTRLRYRNPQYRPVFMTRRWFTYPHGDLFNYSAKCGDYVVQRNNFVYHTIGYCQTTETLADIFHIGSILHIPASLFLAFTLLVLVIFPEKQTSGHGLVHWAALQCHIFTLLLPSTILAFYDPNGDENGFCHISPFVTYFSLVAAALWLNVMCINIGCSFRNVSSTIRRRRGQKMFTYFSVYAWGSAAALTTFTAAMWFSETVPLALQRPMLMETRRCFWEDEERQLQNITTLAYFFVPVTTLLSINALLLVFITLKERQFTKQMSLNESRCTTQINKSALLYVQLLWLLGAAEAALEAGAWARAQAQGRWRRERAYFVGADVLDLARAACVFALCACRPGPLRALRRRLRRAVQGADAEAEDADDAQHAPTSQAATAAATRHREQSL